MNILLQFNFQFSPSSPILQYISILIITQVINFKQYHLNNIYSNKITFTMKFFKHKSLKIKFATSSSSLENQVSELQSKHLVSLNWFFFMLMYSLNELKSNRGMGASQVAFTWLCNEPLWMWSYEQIRNISKATSKNSITLKWPLL